MYKKGGQKALFEIADKQQGFFTSKQAIQCGFSSKNHHYYVKVGEWVKEDRGVYRLANYPLGERVDLMRWYLWSRNQKDIPQGIYSHATALTLYDLSDNMPDKLYMTVPKSFRRNQPIPKILKIYKRNLPNSDVKFYQGVKITTPSRTIIDVIEEDVLSKDLIQQALFESIKKGLIISKRKLLEHDYLKKHPTIRDEVEKICNEKSTGI